MSADHRYIYVNGDSFCEGNYLDTPNDCWPTSLIEAGIHVINDSFGMGSNYRIVRTTFETFSNTPHIFNTAIFGWSSIYRYEVPGQPDSKKPQMFSIDETVKEWNYTPKQHCDAQEHILQENFLTQFVTIENICRTLGITPWHFYAFSQPNPAHILDDINRDRILKKYKRLESANWILPPETTLIDWAKTKNLSFLDDGHLTAESYSVFGNYVKGILA